MFDISSLIKSDTNQIRRLEGSLTTYDSKKKLEQRRRLWPEIFGRLSHARATYERAIW